MKKLNLLILVITISCASYSQNMINMGGGITYKTGGVIELELEKQFTESLSLPLRGDVGYFLTNDYNALILDIHKGYRKTLKSRFVIEQSLGIGGIASFYKVESIWYQDNYGNSIRYSDGANWGIMPSVTLGTGYKLGKNGNSQNLIWVRGKIYWNLGFRGLNLPYVMMQIGYTFNVKK